MNFVYIDLLVVCYILILILLITFNLSIFNSLNCQIELILVLSGSSPSGNDAFLITLLFLTIVYNCTIQFLQNSLVKGQPAFVSYI